MNTMVLNIERTEAPRAAERNMVHVEARQPGPARLRVAAYARVSSDSADQFNSYISQVRYYTQIINENTEWEYVDIYADEGLTGLSAEKRKDFQRLMADCRKGKIDRILCKSVSRFSRNTTDCVMAIRELKLLGVTVLFEKENIDTAYMSGEIFLSLQSMGAQKESISISGNMRQGVRMRMKSGTFLPSSTPYGYTLDLENRSLVIDDEQAAVVRKIYAAYLSGRGMQDIADELNRDGAPKRFGIERWHHTAIFYTLTNLSYTGDMVWQKKFTTDTLPFRKVLNRGEKPRYLVENSHPAIISHEDFERVQELLTERRRNYGGGSPGEYTLSRRIICGECGSVCRRKVTKGIVYWVCRRHDQAKSACPMPQVPESELNAAFIRMHHKLRQHRQVILAPMLDQFRAMADRRYKGNARLTDVNQELNKLLEQANVLNRLRSKGYVEPALYFDQIHALTDKVKALRTVKEALIKQDEIGEASSEIESLLTALEAGPERLDGMDRELFDELVDKITILSAEQVKIQLRCGLELTEAIQRTVR